MQGRLEYLYIFLFLSRKGKLLLVNGPGFLRKMLISTHFRGIGSTPISLNEVICVSSGTIFRYSGEVSGELGVILRVVESSRL